MKKAAAFILTVITVFLFSTCENSINQDYEDSYDTVREKKVKNKNGQGGFDLKPYIDASSRNVRAEDITIYDFEELCSKEYRCNTASIKVNKREHTVTLSNPNARIRGKEYDNLYAKFSYKVKAAGNNLLYLCPVNNGEAEFYIDSVKTEVTDVLPFCLYVSFYGFGEGRIEVSSFLNEESMITGGTYWAVN